MASYTTAVKKKKAVTFPVVLQVRIEALGFSRCTDCPV